MNDDLLEGDNNAKERAFQERQILYSNAMQTASTSPLHAQSAVDASIELLTFTDSIRDADAFVARLAASVRV
jgi:hypothetical protein